MISFINLDRFNEIELENRILLQKMTKIQETSSYSEVFNDGKPALHRLEIVKRNPILMKSLNKNYRK